MGAMPPSDEFGIDADEVEFFATASRFETSQTNTFLSSPRPQKRPRLEHGDAAPNVRQSVDTSNVVGHGKFYSVADTSSPSCFTGMQQSIQKLSVEANRPDAESDCYLPGELEIQTPGARKSKYKIHVPQNGGKLPDLMFSQTQDGLDSTPSRIRGAIWKRPISPPIGSDVDSCGRIQSPRRHNAPIDTVASGVRTKHIVDYFEPPSRPNLANLLDDDAALAARLQEEEVLLSRRAIPPRPPDVIHNNGSFLPNDLADLPSDAFSSSVGGESPEKEVFVISSQPMASQAEPHRLRGPQTGLKQMTIFGQMATQDLTTSQAAKKKHSWPLKSKDEAPTHHKLNTHALATWVYPINLGSIRDYQYNIVSRSLYHNTLVALPTGLGKTFIAATVMLNYYRWAEDAQLVFMAPTKPLIAQQMEACYGIAGIARGDTVLMTGETSPALRAEDWLQKRVFFMTPQTVINDLKTGICDPKRIVLLIVDEAHKATGSYAYTEVIAFMRRFNNSFRVLALTATPGSTVESVQAVIDHLGIARVELRTEQSLDIRQYTHQKQTETEIFQYSDEQSFIMDLFSRALRPVVEKLCSQNAYWSRDPMQLTAYGLTTARQKWMGSDAGRKAPPAVKGMVNAVFTVLSSLAHNIGLLKNHGITPFYSGVMNFQKDVESGQSKGKTATQIAQCEDFTKMMRTIRGWTNNPDFIGHPKLEYLREVVLAHFLDAGEGRGDQSVQPTATRVMVFASFRDSTEEICRVLKRNEPMIRPHVFVGQAASKSSEGMDQKRQNAVIQDFKSGKYNTLIATSIGEEGLDIGTVDLIVCYDASSSPIRMLQRIGRTGRKRVGRVVLLLMKGKEENDYAKAQDNYAYIQKTIADASKYSYRDDQSPRILPKDVQPVVEKRMIDIPVENSQPIDLNEKARKANKRAQPKRPPKKFHMPDGVRTGFVKASKLRSDDEDLIEHTGKKRAAKVRKSSAAPVKRQLPMLPEAAPLPFLQDVILTKKLQDDLEQRYARTVSNHADLVVQAPDPSRHPEVLKVLAKTKYVGHGRTTRAIAASLKAVADVNDARVKQMENSFRSRDLQNDGPGVDRLVSPELRSSQVESALPREEVEYRKDSKRPRGLPRKIKPIQRAASNDSVAAEGSESSPEATPADIRIGTQGIDLGSKDTSGEDDDEEYDSELDAFVARTSDPIEMINSSQPNPSSSKKCQRKSSGRRHAATIAIDESGESDEGSSDCSSMNQNERMVRRTKKRVVLDTDSDD